MNRLSFSNAVGKDYGRNEDPSTEYRAHSQHDMDFFDIKQLIQLPSIAEKRHHFTVKWVIVFL